MRKVRAANPEDDTAGTAFLFRARKPMDREEVLAAFPNKPIADMLVARYFESYDPGIRESSHAEYSICGPDI